MVAYLISGKGSRLIQVTCRRVCLRRLSSESIALNGGIVEGVWVFTRHGDRTPSRPLSAPHRKDEEAAFWRTTLPSPDPVAAFKILSEHFPPDIHPSNLGEFLDVHRRPFGFLTKLGVEQLHANGEKFSDRYDKLGYHCPTTGKTETFLDTWNVEAYSTNYLRTVLSAQCFLDGLLGINSYAPADSHPELDDDVSRLVPDHNTVGSQDMNDAHVTVRVRDRNQDNLNAFDRNPQLIKNLVTEITSAQDFQACDGAAAPLAAKLTQFLPGLNRKGVKTFGGPSGINWIEATDHFICRRSHGVKLCRFSDYEDESDSEGILAAMEHQTIQHLAWRFRRWYQKPALLAEIASPAMREVLEAMQDTSALDAKEKRPFKIYSCHDVTILALLYGLGADILADEVKGDWRFWPTYGTTLVFELVRVKDDIQGKSSHVVRVLLNGEPVRVVDLLDHKQGEDPEYLGTAPLQMLTIADFERIILKLEQVGGMPHERLPLEEGVSHDGRVVKGDI